MTVKLTTWPTGAILESDDVPFPDEIKVGYRVNCDNETEHLSYRIVRRTDNVLWLRPIEGTLARG